MESPTMRVRYSLARGSNHGEDPYVLCIHLGVSPTSVLSTECHCRLHGTRLVLPQLSGRYSNPYIRGALHIVLCNQVIAFFWNPPCARGDYLIVLSWHVEDRNVAVNLEIGSTHPRHLFGKLSESYVPF